jgi:acylphosphatase
MADEMARLHVVISGRVQGVFFRGATLDEAFALGLTGWVRNRPDRKVEIVAEGKRRNLEMLLAWAHQGPSSARVENVDAEWAEYTGEFSGFRIR